MYVEVNKLGVSLALAYMLSSQRVRLTTLRPDKLVNGLNCCVPGAVYGKPCLYLPRNKEGWQS